MVGISTAKKLGVIARRNKAKRRAREAARIIQTEIDRNLDFIISVSSKAEKLPFVDLKAELAGLFARMSERWDGASESS
jgi:ribonuclease P protein component